ncbi:lysylphosphatidylglycerol synthase domain-containing protein [Roseococcus sp. YIM B11640]|uniref:lysylphosphatidylglycerol synthase domain-containing protein n=1 Tax=Roseococcus sp. YIM B11640 TaxID=3133973 RepID=UPI003C79CC23
MRNGLIFAVLVLAALVAINAQDISSVGRVLAAWPLVLLASLAAHLPQLLFTARAWLALLPRAERPRFRRLFMLRWYREAADSLIPAGIVVGQAAVVRLLMRDGMGGGLAAGSAALGITLEAVSQALFTLLGLGAFLMLDHEAGTMGFLIGAGLAGLTSVGLVLVQRPPALALARRLLERLSRRWPRLNPAWIDRLQASLARMHADRGALAQATLCYLGSWCMGAVEMFLLLNIMGHPISFAEALVLESFAQVIRSAGFLLPGAALVQEGGIVAAGALIGVPAGTALTAALIRRTREILVGIVGLELWRRDEARGRA